MAKRQSDSRVNGKRVRGRPKKEAPLPPDGANGALPPDRNPHYVPPPLPWHSLATMPLEAIDWLWDGYLPAGVPSLLYGPSNRGKSTVARYIAAAVTRGHGLPGMEAAPPGNVLWFAAEEGYRSVVKPRLEAAGADPARVFCPEELIDQSIRRLLILRDIRAIQQAVERTSARLIVWDAIFDFAGGESSPFCNDAAQSVMQALADLGRLTGVGSLCIAFPKKGGRGPALEQVSGGMYWMNRARSALLNAPHPTLKKVSYLICSKPALGEAPASLRWSLTKVDGLPRLSWEGEADVTADTLSPSDESGEEEAATADAVGFLKLALAEEAQPVKDLQRRAADNGLSVHQLYRARLKLAVVQEWRVDGEAKASWWARPAGGWPQ
jgi:putative DNA primase/helicase